MLTIVAFIFVLGVLVFIHEFGHFIMAKLVKIRVERFSLGFPPRMIGKKIGETDYCLSWIPIGGYVKMSGMIDESLDKDSIKGEPWEFMSKPIFQRFLVIFAGPLMNILLAVFIFSGITYVKGVNEPAGPTIAAVNPGSFAEHAGFQKGDLILSVEGRTVLTWSEIQEYKLKNAPVPVQWKRGDAILSGMLISSFADSLQRTYPPLVGEVMPDSPAAAVGIQKGDRITGIDEQSILTWEDLTSIVHEKPGVKLMITWSRNDQILSASVVPTSDSPDGKGRIGIGVDTHHVQVGMFHSIAAGYQYSAYMVKVVYLSLKRIIAGQESFKNAFGGPIVIAKMAGESARSGMENLLLFMAFLSLNLGILNLLPIPVLDGGHLLFLAIEGVIRKPIPTKAKIVFQQIGMALLLAFMVFVIINDIRRIW